MAYNGHMIIDGDGHVIEDYSQIVRFMPQSYQEKFDTHTFYRAPLETRAILGGRVDK